MTERSRIFSLFLAVILFLAWCPIVLAVDREDRKEFEKHARKELQSMDKKIKALKSKISRLEKDARKDYDAMLADLEQKREHAGKKWEEIKKAGSEKWDQAKADLNSALKELKESYDRAASRMEGKDTK